MYDGWWNRGVRLFLKRVRKWEERELKSDRPNDDVLHFYRLYRRSVNDDPFLRFTLNFAYWSFTLYMIWCVAYVAFAVFRELI